MSEENPFSFGRIVFAKDFCPRREQVEQLRGHVKSGQNTVILGERRVGKTSLFNEAVRGLKGYALVDVDLWAVKSLHDVADRIMGAIVTMRARDRTLWEKMKKTVSGLRPTLEIDPVTGQTGVSIAPVREMRPESFDGVFDLIGELGRGRKLAVAFDEFQDIRAVEENEALLGRMRARIQRQRGVSYIFSGSIRHEMDLIFREPKSPFFKSVHLIEIGPLPEPEFHKYLRDRFRWGRRKFPRTSFEHVRDLALGNPNDMQQYCSVLWGVTTSGVEIGEKELEEGLERLLAMEKKNCEMQYKSVTGLQQRVLKTLARHGGEHPQSKAFLAVSKVATPASVKGALNRLVNLQHVYGPETQYKFFDPWFRQWLIRKAP